jgi:hypothetical protein
MRVQVLFHLSREGGYLWAGVGVDSQGTFYLGLVLVTVQARFGEGWGFRLRRTQAPRLT